VFADRSSQLGRRRAVLGASTLHETLVVIGIDEAERETRSAVA
jgi:hypothetical protein